MTIAIGVLCKDGGVIAADSQETVSGYWKRRQGKVMAAEFGKKNDLQIAMAGAGRAGYVDALVSELWRAVATGDGTQPQAVEQIRAQLIAFHRDHVVPFHDLPEVQLVMLIQGRAGSPGLFVTDRSTLTPSSERFAAVGIGAGHALSLLHRLEVGITDRMSFDSAVALAAYVIHHTKAHVAECGDHTMIAGIRRGKPVYINEDAIDKMDRQFDNLLRGLEPAIAHTVLGMEVMPREPVLSYAIRGIRHMRKSIAAQSKRHFSPPAWMRVLGE